MCKVCLASLLRTEILDTLGSLFQKAETNLQLITSLPLATLETWPFSGKQECEHKYIQLQTLHDCAVTVKRKKIALEKP